MQCAAHPGPPPLPPPLLLLPFAPEWIYPSSGAEPTSATATLDSHLKVKTGPGRPSPLLPTPSFFLLPSPSCPLLKLGQWGNLHDDSSRATLARRAPHLLPVHGGVRPVRLHRGALRAGRQVRRILQSDIKGSEQSEGGQQRVSPACGGRSGELSAREHLQRSVLIRASYARTARLGTIRHEPTYSVNGKLDTTFCCLPF